MFSCSWLGMLSRLGDRNRLSVEKSDIAGSELVMKKAA